MNSNKTDQNLFSARASTFEQDVCPKCGGSLQLRHGKHGLFLGCSHYPECDYIRSLHQHDGHIIKELGIPCPECGHELVLRQGRYGMFIGCSHFPECHHIESIDNNDSESESVSVICPECKKGHVVERKSRFGKVFWACDHYPKCKFSMPFSPVDGVCSQCGFPLLMQKKQASGTRLVCANRQCGCDQVE